MGKECFLEMGNFTLPSSDFPQNHILTVSEGSSDESPSAISLVHTIQISYYLDLISLVNDSCDLEGERTPDIKSACAHMTNAI